MAANQTIIKAAGQRYAPIKTDYSGYIQGVSAIANGLIQKKKNFNANKESIKDTYAQAEKYVDDENVLNEIRELRILAYEELDKTKGIAGIFRSSKHKDYLRDIEKLSVDYTRAQNKRKNLLEAHGNDEVSNGETALDESWWTEVRDEGWDFEYKQKVVTNKETGEQTLSENKTLHVKGPNGEFVPYDKVPKTFLTVESSDGIYNDFKKLLNNDDINFYVDFNNARSEYEEGGTLKPVKDKYDLAMESNIRETMSELKDGNGGVNDAFRSFAVDQKFRLPSGKGETTFAEYYMSNPDLYGEVRNIEVDTDGDGTADQTIGEFAAQFSEINKDASTESINKQIQIIFNDIVKNGSDNNIMQDMEDFLTYLYKR